MICRPYDWGVICGLDNADVTVLLAPKAPPEDGASGSEAIHLGVGAATGLFDAVRTTRYAGNYRSSYAPAGSNRRSMASEWPVNVRRGHRYG